LTFSGSGKVIVGTLSNYATSPALVVTGTDSLVTTGSNSVTINVSSLGTVAIGNTYKLIGYSGSIGGSGTGGFVLGTPLPSRAIGSLVNIPGEIDVTISAIDFLKWTGNASLPNGWDTATQNWKLASNNNPATFFNNPADAVLFDDSASAANTAVIINTANVTPSSVLFDNSARNYTFQGSFAITGTTSVIKNGTGSVTFFNSNSFSGGSPSTAAP